MALKDYYELTAMLRIQLPILLSFAVVRCLMGWVANFWSRALVPRRLKPFLEPVREATATALSCAHGILLIASVGYSVNFHKLSNTSLVCAEFNNVRVQGLTCAMGLLALFTNSDAFTLSMSLCVFKAVVDGSVSVLMLAALTWGASTSMHYKYSAWYFGSLFGATLSYTGYCYTDDPAENRTGGTILAASFAALLLGARLSLAGIQRTWRGFQRCCVAAMHLLRTTAGTVRAIAARRMRHAHQD